jgi:hypothetical protein
MRNIEQRVSEKSERTRFGSRALQVHLLSSLPRSAQEQKQGKVIEQKRAAWIKVMGNESRSQSQARASDVRPTNKTLLCRHLVA